ncbi:AAA family ATPase [uncultured Microbulbifer sp.]|uniref:AAA family ATPase n=1 Tax=uncultured Microbulbifer sp. TaxID=348147 RepID=UPI0025DC115F|nr:AAA family ATPase [uncultured Microbulbifer sp.]
MSEADEVLKLLAEHKNVLLSGPPGTGKSMVLSKVAALFSMQTGAGNPTYNPTTGVPIPATPAANLPGHINQAANRKVFRTVLHQSSKHRDFFTGLIPDARSGATPGKFRITEGTLYKASEFAKQPGCASLLIIDEINRGPTVQVFGGAIVAIEPEKRLDDSGNATPSTQFFDLLDPSSGDIIEYAFPARLYILAAMNQADVSVEPLDVAFLRRWAPFSLEPSEKKLRDHFNITAATSPLPTSPSSRDEVLEAAVQAFSAINNRVSLGRGPEFQIGHGMLMATGSMPTTKDEALTHVAVAWRVIKNHIDEAFFGDVRGTAIVLNADKGLQGNPYVLEENSFGDTPRAQIKGPGMISENQIYDLLLALAKIA